MFFLQKHIDSLQEAFVHPPEPCEARFIMDRCDYLHFFELLNRNTTDCHYKARKSRTFFKYYSDWIHLKEKKSYTPRMPWGWVNHGLI